MTESVSCPAYRRIKGMYERKREGRGWEDDDAVEAEEVCADTKPVKKPAVSLSIKPWYAGILSLEKARPISFLCLLDCAPYPVNATISSHLKELISVHPHMMEDFIHTHKVLLPLPTSAYRNTSRLSCPANRSILLDLKGTLKVGLWKVKDVILIAGIPGRKSARGR